MRPSYYVRRIVPRRYHRPLRNAVARVQAPLLRGTARYCPICDQSFRRFLPATGRDDATCPRCYGVERHRMLFLYLRDLADIFNTPQRLLHIAPENCLEPRLRAVPRLDYVTGDLEAPADLQLDLTASGLPDDSFDVVICLHILEHIPDDRAAMHELRRIVRPGGVAILDVPFSENGETIEPDTTDPHERYRILGQHDHVRLYGRPEFRRRLEECGFEVSLERVVGHLPPAECLRIGVPSHASLHICRPATGAHRESGILAAAEQGA